MIRGLTTFTALALASTVLAGSVKGDVIATGENGFQIRIIRQIAKPTTEVYDAIVGKIGNWWSSNHTWSGDASNLSIDLQRAAMIEILPDGGFCRHLEIVLHQPGKTLRLRGGLGPLQEMGLDGSLTIKTLAKDDGTEVVLTYNISGFSPGGFAPLGPLVDGVLTEQVDRLVRFCETGAAEIR